MNVIRIGVRITHANTDILFLDIIMVDTNMVMVNGVNDLGFTNDIEEVDIDIDFLMDVRDVELDLEVDEFVDSILQKELYLVRSERNLDAVRTKLFELPTDLSTPIFTDTNTGASWSVSKDQITSWETLIREYFENIGYTTTTKPVLRGLQIGIKRSKTIKKRDFTVTLFPNTGRIQVQTSLIDEFKAHVNSMTDAGREQQQQ